MDIYMRERQKWLTSTESSWWKRFLSFTSSSKLWGPVIVVALVYLALKMDSILQNLFPLS